jgi:YesN/AraC family two-component response regulator
MNCIIIDDEEMASYYCTIHFKEYRYTIENEFSNAFTGIKYLNQNDVDLIFFDIHMPDFTGFISFKPLKTSILK